MNAVAPGNVLVTTDENTANGSTPDIQRIHDLQGRVVREVRADGTRMTDYLWDQAGQLLKVVDRSPGSSAGTWVADTEATYYYDAEGEMSYRRLSTKTGGTLSNPIYTTVPEFYRHIDGQMVMQFNQYGHVVGRYYSGEGQNQLLGVARRPNTSSAWEPKFVGQDEQMSVREVVDGSGGRDWYMDYSDFGVASAVKMDAGVPDDRRPVFGCTGEHKDGTADVTTGLMNYGMGLSTGWYSPELGRFISPDQAGFGAGDGNLYWPMNNDPIRVTDSAGTVPTL